MTTLLQLELRRAVMTWPDGFDWSAPEDDRSVRHAPVLARTSGPAEPIGTLTAVLDGDGRPRRCGVATPAQVGAPIQHDRHGPEGLVDLPAPVPPAVVAIAGGQHARDEAGALALGPAVDQRHRRGRQRAHAAVEGRLVGDAASGDAGRLVP